MNYSYIKMPKSFCKIMQTKLGNKTINVMTMPKGTIVGEKDLSMATINPPVMYDSEVEKDIMIGRFDKEQLKDNSVKISFFDFSKATRVEKEVDIDVLKKAIDKSVRDYYYERANTMSKEKEYENEEEYTL